MGSLKDHCISNSHMKALRSFKAIVLKMPAEVGQKKVHMSGKTCVSQDEFKLLKRKVNIAYFVAKNDI